MIKPEFRIQILSLVINIFETGTWREAIYWNMFPNKIKSIGEVFSISLPIFVASILFYFCHRWMPEIRHDYNCKNDQRETGKRCLIENQV